MQQTNKLSPFFENLNFEREDNTMVINFGPQHPSAHGQLRLVLELDGEQVVKAYPDIGYLHRGVEKMAENMTYNEFLPTTDRLDYIASTANNYGYALAVEKLLGIEAPRRAKVIRTMLLELNRIISHLFFIATHALDIGAMSVFLYAFREREFAMDLMEDYCGARLTHSSVRIGGVPLDIPSDWMENVSKFCDTVEKEIEVTYEALLTENRIWKMRLEDVGVVPPEEALSWGCTGPMLRGSGITYDIRKEEPYELYSELDFDIPISDTNDSYGRYRIYIEEMKQSIRILRQLIPMYDDTKPQLMAHAPQYISAPKEEIMTQNYALMQHFVLVTQGMRPPKGEVYVATESPKGELGFYIKSEGEPYAYRLKIRAPSFYHTGYLQKMLLGAYIPDVVTMISTTNIVFGEVDR
ncbi:NADH-ubiquinone oxidoreductase chain D [hydrothermal vent metagenome]|uniref:NADH-ubiquinone oxidoreductase chain D n=1 Tax=hydrothermal vent metagenome TaxID=652676 RepID=A0A1W1B9M7_9ZZZZ